VKLFKREHRRRHGERGRGQGVLSAITWHKHFLSHLLDRYVAGGQVSAAPELQVDSLELIILPTLIAQDTPPF